MAVEPYHVKPNSWHRHTGAERGAEHLQLAIVGAGEGFAPEDYPTVVENWVPEIIADMIMLLLQHKIDIGDAFHAACEHVDVYEDPDTESLVERFFPSREGE